MIENTLSRNVTYVSVSNTLGFPVTQLLPFRVHLVDPLDESLISPEVINPIRIFQAELLFVAMDSQEFTKSCMFIPHMHALGLVEYKSCFLTMFEKMKSF